MRFSHGLASLMAVVGLCSTTAFVPRTSLLSPSTKEASSTKDTRLFISSWGVKGPPSRWSSSQERENPADKVQAYLKEPTDVQTRDTLTGTCLVSGVVNAKERTDQFLFDLLNQQESKFAYDKIIAFVNDIKFSKKRLLSRSARYTGLLDKLDFLQAASDGALPVSTDLEGVSTWVSVIENPNVDMIRTICQTAQNAPSVQNLCILMSGSASFDGCTYTTSTEREQIIQCMNSLVANKPSLSYTVTAVGDYDDTRTEGQRPYQMIDITNVTTITNQLLDTANTTITSTSFSRDESYRMIVELLQLESGKNQIIALQDVLDVNATSAKLVKGLREAGYNRVQEIDHIVQNGIENYEAAIEEFKNANPDWEKGYTTDIWWEQEIYQESDRKREQRELEKAKDVKDARTLQVEEIAREWAKREYFRESMAGTLPNPNMTEREYTESVWETAMFQGDIKYRQMKGEETDEESEYDIFKEQQERKKETMLLKAKQELQAVLDEEDKPIKDDNDSSKDE